MNQRSLDVYYLNIVIVLLFYMWYRQDKKLLTVNQKIFMFILSSHKFARATRQGNKYFLEFYILIYCKYGNFSCGGNLMEL